MAKDKSDKRIIDINKPTKNKTVRKTKTIIYRKKGGVTEFSSHDLSHGFLNSEVYEKEYPKRIVNRF